MDDTGDGVLLSGSVMLSPEVLSASRRSGASSASTTITSLEVPVGGGPRDAVVTGQRIRGGPVAEPPQPQRRIGPR